MGKGDKNPPKEKEYAEVMEKTRPKNLPNL
jgi:hypothetical protein